MAEATTNEYGDPAPGWGWCHVADPLCLAPAGWRAGGGGIGENEEGGPVGVCWECGEHVCRNCSIVTRRFSGARGPSSPAKGRVCGDCCSGARLGADGPVGDREPAYVAHLERLADG